MENFFTADLHAYHFNILKYEHRPFKSIQEMNEKLIENWNNKVTNKDNVYILGDFALATPKQTIILLNRLNGNKFLIKGNHDRVVIDNSSVREKFCWVKDYYVLKINKYVVVLFHYPIQVWDRKHYGSIHLYGHVHSNHPMENKIDNSYNVGVDVNNYEPISFDEILIKMPYKYINIKESNKTCVL